MFHPTILLLGLALALDASIVSFAVGLLHQEHSFGDKLKNGFYICALFGGFQFIMLWGGAHVGYLFTFSNYGYYFQLAIGVIFFGLAFKCFQDSFSQDKKTVSWGLLPVLLLGLLTSVDAFISGMSFGTLPQSYLAALEVGMITFILCSAFYFSGQFFQRIPERWLLRLAGSIFCFLGGQILWSFQNFLV
jgi:putative Mn2+ efflux pump MntP